MPRDPLNFFSPFENLPPNHENQLTRALLVVLRFSPMAHATWLRLVVGDVQLQKLPPAEFNTQRKAIRRSTEGDKPARLVSVFLTPEEPLDVGVVTESDRGQVLDAIVDYGGELLAVIENKVAAADARQARELNVAGAGVHISSGQPPITVLWRDVLEAFMGLRERKLLGGAEDTLLDDFLTYVEDHFPKLGPFRTLRLAHGNRSRQVRRLRQLLGEAVGVEAVADDYGGYVSTPAPNLMGARAYLCIRDEARVELALYPADTLNQARAFYEQPDVLRALRGLCTQPGWQAEPNFHFGYIQTGCCGTRSNCDLEQYVTLWVGRIGQEGSVPRERWDQYWTWLQEARIACPEDRAEFDTFFLNSKREWADPRPGLYVARRWSLDEAEALDAGGELRGQVREAMNAARVAFGQPPLPAAPTT